MSLDPQACIRMKDMPLQERPRGDFQIGVRIFPTLAGPPPTLAIRNDLALVDTLDVDAVSVVLSPSDWNKVDDFGGVLIPQALIREIVTWLTED